MRVRVRVRARVRMRVRVRARVRIRVRVRSGLHPGRDGRLHLDERDLVRYRGDTVEIQGRYTDLVVHRLVHLRRERADEVEEELNHHRLSGRRQRVAGGHRIEWRRHELDSSSVRHGARGKGVWVRRHEGERRHEDKGGY